MAVKAKLTPETFLARSRELLPPGTGLADRDTDVEPAWRFLLVRGADSHEAIMFPQEPFCAQTILHALYGSQVAAWRASFMAGGSTEDDGQSVRIDPIGLTVPERADWPISGRAADTVSAVILGRRRRQIGFYVDAASNAPIGLVKAPNPSAGAAALRRGYDALRWLQRNDLRISPNLLTAAAGPLYMQEFVQGGRLAKEPAENAWQLTRWLTRLSLTDEATSLRAIADDTAARLTRNARRFEANETHALLALLNRVTSTRPLPAARMHGDLQIANLLLVGRHQLVAVDWELTERHGLSVLDLATWLTQYKVEDTTVSAATIYDPPTHRLISRYCHETGIADAAPPHEVAALHFCWRYVSLRAIGGVGSWPMVGALFRPWPESWG